MGTEIRSALKNLTVVAFVVVILAVGGVVAISSSYGGPTPKTAATGLLIHVVNGSSGPPMAGVRVLAGPASSVDDLAFTPGGPTLKECVHGVPSGSDVLGNGTVVFPNGTRITYPACPLKTYTTDSAGLVSIPEAAGEYYFFSVGGIPTPSFVYGIVRLSQSGETYVTANWPNGNYTVTS